MMTIHYDFPKVEGEIFMHAFCVMDADTVEVHSTMPSDFSYKQAPSAFDSGTKLFGKDSFLTPAVDSIRTRRECLGGTYLQPSHEYYRPKKKKDGFAYKDQEFGMDLRPSPGNDSVTVCAFVPDPHWGLLTGGWNGALRDDGFEVTGTFEDSGEMVWEVYCKEISASTTTTTTTTTQEQQQQQHAKQNAALSSSETSSVSSEETDDDVQMITAQTENPEANLTQRQIRRRRQRLRRPTMEPRPVSLEDERLQKGFIY